MLFPSKSSQERSGIFARHFCRVASCIRLLVGPERRRRIKKRQRILGARRKFSSLLTSPASLANAKGESAPTIIYVGFRTLFEGGHIPGASFHGTASTEKGLAELERSGLPLCRGPQI